MQICGRCNRTLKSQKSIDNGMGPVCKRKHEAELTQREFEKNQITIDEVIVDDNHGQN